MSLPNNKKLSILYTLEILKENKVQFCGPADGHVACGAGGSGRMEEPQTIFDAVEKYFGK